MAPPATGSLSTRTRMPRAWRAVGGLSPGGKGAVEVVDGGKREDVEEVVTVAYNVEMAWIEALGHS